MRIRGEANCLVPYLRIKGDTVLEAIGVNVGTWGPATILTIVAIGYFTGKIGWSGSFEKRLNDLKDAQSLREAAYVNETRRTAQIYEARISDLRLVATDAVATLRIAQENIHTQLEQSNETLELSRLIAPIMLGLKRVVDEDGQSTRRR